MLKSILPSSSFQLFQQYSPTYESNVLSVAKCSAAYDICSVSAYYILRAVCQVYRAQKAVPPSESIRSVRRTYHT